MCLGGADKMQSLDTQIYYNEDMGGTITMGNPLFYL